MKTFIKGWNIFTTLLLIAVLLLALLLVGVRLIGLKPFPQHSDEMEPAYPQGSLIYVKPTAPSEINVGDPVTYVVNESLDVATRRVSAMDAPAMTLYVKADTAGEESAAPVNYQNVLGVPVLAIPYLGRVLNWLQSPRGIAVGAAAALVLVMLPLLPALVNRTDRHDEDAEEQEEAEETEGEVEK